MMCFDRAVGVTRAIGERQWFVDISIKVQMDIGNGRIERPLDIKLNPEVRRKHSRKQETEE